MSDSNNEDVLNYTILSDGRIVWDTDQISAQNHQNADQFMREVARLMGGPVTTTKKRQQVGHSHVHGHDHTHGGH